MHMRRPDDGGLTECGKLTVRAMHTTEELTNVHCMLCLRSIDRVYRRAVVGAHLVLDDRSSESGS